ncbi:MAG: carboxypeptidase-like regulatory domain-containing protein [Bacteroidota bacterium]
MQLNIPLFIKGLCSTILGLGFALSATAQGTLSGTITDADGEALFGVNILVKSNATGTISDFDGRYELSVPEGSQTVVFSYTGYSTYELNIDVSSGSSYTQDITLSQDALLLDELVVTGTFSGRTQKESPMSITILNASQLQRLSSNSQADILRTIPGITAEGGGGEVASNVFVRGMPSGGQYQFTPLQVDGLPVLSTFGLNSSAHDVYFRNDIGIRNLEFVRGGSSTLFGAGSVAGIINYSSVTGSATPENKVQLEWANGGRVKADFLSAGPLSENTFYAVSGFYRYDDGPLETGMATQGYQIRGNIKRLFNNGESSFTVYGQLINDNVQFYLPYPLANDNGQRERPTGNDGEEIFTLLTSQATDFSFDTPFGRFESPIGNGVSTQGGYLMLDLKHSFGNDWRLSAKAKTASYNHFFNLFLDGDGVNNVPETQADYLSSRGLPADAVLTYADDGSRLAAGDLLFQNRILDRERPMNEIVGEAYVTKTAGRHNFSIGTFLANTRADDNNWISNFVGDFRNAPRMVNVNFVDSLGNPASFSNSGFISGSQTANRYHTSSKVALFVGDEYKGDKFNLDVGLRWEQNTGTIVRETGVGSNTFQRGEVQTSDVAIAIAGLYKLSNTTNIYANFSRGYFFPELRSINFSSSAPGRPQSFQTESVLQGEAGIKYGNDKLAITGALFYVGLNDRRSVDFINDPNNPGNIIEEVLVQSTRTFGIETSLNYNLAKGLNFYGNFTFQDHEFTEVEGNEEQEGNELRRQPNIMGMAGLSYEQNGFDANISSNFLGSKFANDANTVELDGFNIVRLDLGYRFSLGQDESMRLGVSVFNLLDTDGVTEGSPRQGNSQTGSSEFFVGRPILPRRIFVRAAFDF